MVKPNRKTRLLGLGLDDAGGHVRITRGRNFHLLGGSQDTHEAMQEKCIKLNEKLDARGKQLDDLDRGELHDLAAECDINMFNTDSKGKEDQEL